MGTLRDNLLVQFSVISFVLLAVMALSLAYILSNKVRVDAINDLVDEAIGTSSGLLLGAITPSDFEEPMTGERYDRFHEFVQQYVVSDRTARIKIRAKDGTIIYADNPEAVGKKFPPNEPLLKALRGENVAIVRVPTDATHVYEADLGRLMEVVTPINFPDSAEPPGVFALYQYYEPTASRINELRRWIFGSIGAGLLILYGSLVS